MLGKLRAFAKAFRLAQKKDVTLQRRLVFFLVCLALAAISVLLLLLTITGVFSSSESKLRESLNIQLRSSHSRIGQNMEQLSARGIDLADMLTRQLDGQLLDSKLTISRFNSISTFSAVAAGWMNC